VHGLEKVQSRQSNVENTGFGQGGLVLLEVGLQCDAVPWHHHVGKEELTLGLGEQNHAVCDNLRGRMSIFGVLLLEDFLHGVYFVTKFLILSCKLDYKWSVNILNVYALVNLSERSLVNESSDHVSVLELGALDGLEDLVDLL
jgi:hypothetical protein